MWLEHCLKEEMYSLSFPLASGKVFVMLPAAFDSIGKREHGHSIIVVVTPLLAIMKDQVRQSTLGVIIIY